MPSGPDHPAFPKVMAGTFRLAVWCQFRGGPCSRWHHPTAKLVRGRARDSAAEPGESVVWAQRRQPGTADSIGGPLPVPGGFGRV